MKGTIHQAIEWIKSSKHTTAFTGAGISVESGIPPFRGPHGLWNKYDPQCLDLNYFDKHPEKAWPVIKEIFYDFFDVARPNKAHDALARMEAAGLLNAVITQNIDNLHQEAGSKTVYEFHGNSKRLVCRKCNKYYKVKHETFAVVPPKCECGTILKPDFIFFGEMIPEEANMKSFMEADMAEVFIMIGTTGEVMPANILPRVAKKHGAKIIEVNTSLSAYTDTVTDIFLQGKATEIMWDIIKGLDLA
ncbi:MAG: NAD-dependent deacylase [Bacteroidales bacterium]|nr:NAD-dependent deacylase [Bacteroidales bacterium]